MRPSIKALVLLSVITALTSAMAAEEKDIIAALTAELGPERVATTPVPARWKFSNDGGKTYSLDSLPEVPVRGKPQVWGQTEVTIDDPAKVGMLWVTTDSPVGGISPVDDQQLGPRYIRLVPVLLNAVCTVNDKVVPFEMDDMLFYRLGIDPILLKKGPNVITLKGNFWNPWVNHAQAFPVKVGFRTMISPPDVLDLRTGPVLGPLGNDYFTLVCRTHIPAEIKISVKPLDPDGAEKVCNFPRGTLHRLRVDLPKDTKKFRYSVTAVNGPHSRITGPFDVRIPGTDAMRFVVLGQTAANSNQRDALVAAAKALQKTDPDFIIHTGSIVKMAYWDADWDDIFFLPWRDLLARTPICVVPAYRDAYSMAFGRLFYHATPGGEWDLWTWSAGNVRFIGMDSMAAARNADACGKWVEDVLKKAGEDYIFSVNAYPGFIEKPFGRGIDGHNFDKNVVHPLLAKYKATAALGCTGAYEYVPAAGDKGVATIITGGVGAEMRPGWSTFHYCVFTIKEGKCTMEAIAYETGKVLDSKTFAPRKK